MRTPVRRRIGGALTGLGLRSRVVLSFAVGALLLSTALSVVTWSLSASYLLAQRTRIATVEATERAELVRQGLAAGTTIPLLLERVSSPQAEGLLWRGGEWFSSTLALTPDDLPRPLVDAVTTGEAVRQRLEVDGRRRLAVGVPLPSADAAFFVLLPLEELDATLRTLSVVLAGATAATSLGGAALGVWASRRALRPLVRLNDAAAAVAAGDLGTRLDTDDPDLTELAATFNETVAALEQRVHADARFASDVSHELRSPLATLTNAVRVLEARSGELPATAASMVAVMQAEVDRFSRIVRDLLDISLDATGSGISLEPVRLAELVRAAVPALQDRLVVDPAAESSEVLVDRRRLERVVVNLVENADKHAGGVDRIVLERPDGHLRLSVEDRGPGVPPERRHEVFERFARGAQARTGADGAGLGLALVAQHVRLHGGQVRVEDRPGGGARFVVELPVDEDER